MVRLGHQATGVLIMRWLVTGASGRLGRDLCRTLRIAGHDVSSPPRSELDICDSDAVATYMNQHEFDVVVNAAAYTNVDRAETDHSNLHLVNEWGVQNLAHSAAKQAAAWFIQVSTDHVFGDGANAGRLLAESAPVRPVNSYGKSKARSEHIVRKLMVGRSAIVRTAWLYSPGSSNFVTTMASRALRGERSEVVADQWGQPTWTRDVAVRIVTLGCRLTMGLAPAGNYHATNAGQTTWCELARRVYERAGADIELVVPIGSSKIPRAATRPPWSVLGHAAWARAGMPPPRPWEQALDEALPLFLQAESS